jgi:hypothetical protein
VVVVDEISLVQIRIHPCLPLPSQAKITKIAVDYQSTRHLSVRPPAGERPSRYFQPIARPSYQQTSSRQVPLRHGGGQPWGMCRIARRQRDGGLFELIDSIRKQIEEQLDQLLGEAEKLRRALVALDPRAGSPPPSAEATPRARPAPTRQRRTQTRRTRRRTAPGATKARVLEALSNGKAMTAGEVASATGLARPTVSTTLSKLAKSGEVLKAERGYRLP